ncbi:hypothetical protein Sjap_023970 [Stephania japonica]|uniref:Uncharacterized protein n=1 Tax=Stephania japonica TaxID=461633 RepID=A0AAP0HJG3_9MAGN
MGRIYFVFDKSAYSLNESDDSTYLVPFKTLAGNLKELSSNLSTIPLLNLSELGPNLGIVSSTLHGPRTFQPFVYDQGLSFPVLPSQMLTVVRQ